MAASRKSPAKFLSESLVLESFWGCLLRTSTKASQVLFNHLGHVAVFVKFVDNPIERRGKARIGWHGPTVLHPKCLQVERGICCELSLEDANDLKVVYFVLKEWKAKRTPSLCFQLFQHSGFKGLWSQHYASCQATSKSGTV